MALSARRRLVITLDDEHVFSQDVDTVELEATAAGYASLVATFPTAEFDIQMCDWEPRPWGEILQQMNEHDHDDDRS